MFLVRSSIKNSRLITSLNSNGVVINNSNVCFVRTFSTGDEPSASEIKKSLKQQKKEEELRLAKLEEENKVYGAGSLSLITAKKVETKKVNQRKLLKPREPKEKRETELQRQYSPLVLDEEQQKYSITKQDLKQQIDENKVDDVNTFIIDLRSPKEFFADSPIKVSQNIPMEYPKIIKVETTHTQKRGKKNKTVETKKAYDADSELNFWQKVCKLTPLQWKEKYGFNKVKPTDNIIFYSANNGRSYQVVEMAIKSGFVNSKFLEGGIRNWNKHFSQ